MPTIAFISGQPALSAILVRTLRQYGHFVLSCPTAVSLHNQTSRADIDMVVVDAEAVGGTPIELAAELRAALGMVRPLIAMTKVDAAFRPLYVAAGFDAVLPKPVGPLQLHVCAMAFAPTGIAIDMLPIEPRAKVFDFWTEKRRRQSKDDQALNSAS